MQVAVTNASGKTITQATGLHVKMNNSGTITTPYAIYTEGDGVTHLEDYIEVKRPAATPGTPATDFIRLYSKANGNLYAKDWNGVEYNLTSGSNSAAVLLTSGKVSGSPVASVSLTSIAQTSKRLQLVVHLRSTATPGGGVDLDPVRIQFNADTTAGHYFYERFGYQSTGTLAGENIGTTASIADLNCPNGNTASGLFGGVVVDIFDYTNTIAVKDCQWKNNWAMALASSNLATVEGSGWFSPTAALTQIDIVLGSGNIDVGSTYELWGLG